MNLKGMIRQTMKSAVVIVNYLEVFRLKFSFVSGDVSNDGGTVHASATDNRVTSPLRTSRNQNMFSDRLVTPSHLPRHGSPQRR